MVNFKTLTQISLNNVHENEKETTAFRFLLFMFEWLKSLNSGKMATLSKMMKAKISELFYANSVVRIRQKKNN